MTNTRKSFKEKKTYAQRVQEVQRVHRDYPNKIPIVVERFHGEKQLPLLHKSKFLVPDYLDVGRLVLVIRKMLYLRETQTLFLIINQRSIVTSSLTMRELYNQEKDPDGFLYVVYAAQETFGAVSS